MVPLNPLLSCTYIPTTSVASDLTMSQLHMSSLIQQKTFFFFFLQGWACSHTTDRPESKAMTDGNVAKGGENRSVRLPLSAKELRVDQMKYAMNLDLRI